MGLFRVSGGYGCPEVFTFVDRSGMAFNLLCLQWMQLAGGDEGE